ncbi:DUF3037 domain-containing protein [Myroides sp. LJL119]
MQVYEYAIIRYVPRVEREEFINIGLLLFCKSKKVLLSKFHLDKEKIACFSSQIDFDVLQLHVQAFDNIAKATPCASPIANLETSERFRWLSAVKSSVLQSSRPHVGLSQDLQATFDKLFEELVL